ncbi:MAG: VOC family protein [Sphingorhabdus sp.]
MSVKLNHTIIWCHDKQASSAFMTDILGLSPAVPFVHFMVVTLDNDVSVDFMEKDGDIALQHYAFLVSDEEFDAAFARINDAQLEYWADPARSLSGQINHHFGGRGVYFEDPDGHLLEIMTKPYGKENEV